MVPPRSDRLLSLAQNNESLSLVCSTVSRSEGPAVIRMLYSQCSVIVRRGLQRKTWQAANRSMECQPNFNKVSQKLRLNN